MLVDTLLARKRTKEMVACSAFVGQEDGKKTAHKAPAEASVTPLGVLVLAVQDRYYDER